MPTQSLAHSSLHTSTQSSTNTSVHTSLHRPGPAPGPVPKHAAALPGPGTVCHRAPRCADPTRRSLAAAALSILATPHAGLGLGLAGPAGALAAPRQAMPPLQLAREARDDVDPAGYLVSEKLDGVRAWWDGERLRFRSGLPVMAPRWFTTHLPALPLDGELWLGRGRFEELSGLVRRQAAQDDPWREMRYVVFDLRDEGGHLGPFERRVELLRRAALQAAHAPLQIAPQRAGLDRAALRRWLHEVVQGGGEGLVLHRADAAWRAGRTDALLKLKPVHDAEAVVVGHVAGQGRHQGRLGALHVRTTDGVEFLIGTGFTDRQREQPPAVGSTVVFTHRGMTNGGVPRFASFLRVRDPARS